MTDTMTGPFLVFAVAIQWLLTALVVFGLRVLAEFVTAIRTMPDPEVIVNVQLAVLTVFLVAVLLATVSVWGFFLIPPGLW